MVLKNICGYLQIKSTLSFFPLLFFVCKWVSLAPQNKVVVAWGSDYKISFSKSSSSVCPLLQPPSVCPSVRPPQSLGFQAVSQLTAVQPGLRLFASIIPELLVRVSVFTPRPEVSFDPRCPCQSFTLRGRAGCYIIPPSARAGSLRALCSLQSTLPLLY